MNVSIQTATIIFIKEPESFFQPFLTIIKIILISTFCLRSPLYYN